MFSSEQNEVCHKLNYKFDRVVIGAGALGLFLSSIIQKEFPDSNLTILTKSPLSQNIFIHNLQKESSKAHFPNFFLVDHLKLSYPTLTSKCIVFYICIPPESIHLSFQYIEKILFYLYTGKKKIYLVFLNNGILDKQLFQKLKSAFIKYKDYSFFLIRAVVLSGFMRTQFPDQTTIENTSGNIIYYGYFQKSALQNISLILPKGYFKWIYTKNIIKMERAKFLVNFMLGFFIGPKKISNNNILNILTKEKRREIFLNYSSLFPEDKLTPQYLEKYFNDTIKHTASNINSVSFSWSQGNKKPIEYFVANIEKMAYLSDNKDVHRFFKNLMNSYFDH